LKAIVETCERLGVTLISDEIYHGLDFGGISPTALEFTDRAIVINSFSKYHCMTGWRLGWMVVPEPLVRRAEMLAQSFFISPPTLSQTAGLAALNAQDYAGAQVARYRANREILCTGLEALGLAVHRPDGAFYAYADVSSVTGDSMGFCLDLLEEAGVAATPGLDFDRVEGHRFVRFSYAGSEDTMKEALRRMARFLAR
jgi:aspartate/methionine/tyrosine aminotransferase